VRTRANLPHASGGFNQAYLDGDNMDNEMAKTSVGPQKKGRTITFSVDESVARSWNWCGLAS
tara:strand:+ start:21 stop:206 length:186 start_codon:yes stop_codon:yes gene_type:complete